MDFKKISYKLKGVGEAVLSLLYPNICPFCGKILKKTEKQGMCVSCELRLPFVYEPRCKKCGKPIEKETKEYCWDCEQHHHFYDRGVAVWEHGPLVSNAIYQFKYHNRRIYSRFFAKEMVQSNYSIIRRWNIDLIVPIPVSKKRKRQRGYNQTELLAKEISRMLDIPYSAKSLVRVKDTAPQKKLNVRQRKYNLLNAFEWRGEPLSGENILLIDDIYTTGNTIDVCAQIIRKTGAKKVFFLTISIGQGY